LEFRDRSCDMLGRSFFTIVAHLNRHLRKLTESPIKGLDMSKRGAALNRVFPLPEFDQVIQRGSQTTPTKFESS
jgi:hypothetical protein